VFGGERELDMAAIDRQSLIQEITRLYLNEFTQVWIDLLSDVTVVPFTSLDQAVEVLRLLSEQESSPLKRLLEAVANETMLIREEETPSGAKQGAAQDFWNSMAERIKAVIPSSAREQEAAGEVAAASLEIRQHPLQEIHDFVRGTDKNPPPLEAVLKSLYDLYIQVDAIASAVQGGSGVPPDLKAKLDGVVAQIQREARGRPAMVRNLLERVSKNSQLLAESGQYKRLNAAWMSDVLPFYRQAIAGRYPLVRSSLHEVTLDDFARFFGPGGIVESFFQQHLQDLVDTSAKVWRVRPGQQGVGVSAETLRQFQRAGEIRKAFFGGGQSPVVSFQLKPIVLDADVNQFLLEVDGQQVSYSHGPTVVQSLKWPGPGDLKQARIQFSATSASDRNARTEDGPWAWFRILDMAKIEGTSQPERFIATFEVGGHRATYEIRASSAFNPFRAIFIDRVLERFHCPPAL
jgi:type VI secretion system protein ImpL